MRNRVALWRTLLIIGVALAVVSGPREVLGQGGTWIPKAPIPTPREGLAVGVVNEILYAVGGEIVHAGVGGYVEFLSTVEAYDPSTNSWSSKAPLLTPRGGLTVGVVNRILYALGGFSKDS
jgi:N-acetylneuraminic acid mutarotase